LGQPVETELKSTKEKLNNLEVQVEQRMHSKLEVAQSAIQLDLQLKEEILKDTREKYKFSEGRINKMEDFIKTQKGKIEHLEQTCEKNNQEKLLLQTKLQKMENDDTLKNIIDELNDQHDQDVKKLSQEKETTSKLKTKIQTLEDDINSLKSSHHVEYQKMELLMSNLQSELTKESKNLQEEVHKNEKLKQELNTTKIGCMN